MEDLKGRISLLGIYVLPVALYTGQPVCPLQRGPGPSFKVTVPQKQATVLGELWQV